METEDGAGKEAEEDPDRVPGCCRAAVRASLDPFISLPACTLVPSLSLRSHLVASLQLRVDMLIAFKFLVHSGKAINLCTGTLWGCSSEQDTNPALTELPFSWERPTKKAGPGCREVSFMLLKKKKVKKGGGGELC